MVQRQGQGSWPAWPPSRSDLQESWKGPIGVVFEPQNRPIPTIAMRFQEIMVKADDGIELFVRVYQPLSESADRTLLLVHGMAEHGQRYLPAARLMVARGWNVLV